MQSFGKDYKLPKREKTVWMYVENILLICLQSSYAVGHIYPYMWHRTMYIPMNMKRLNYGFIYKLTYLKYILHKGRLTLWMYVSCIIYLFLDYFDIYIYILFLIYFYKLKKYEIIFDLWIKTKSPAKVSECNLTNVIKNKR